MSFQDAARVLETVLPPSDEKVYGGVLKNTTLLWLVPHFPQALDAPVARLDQSGIRPMNGHQDLQLPTPGPANPGLPPAAAGSPGYELTSVL